jgi:hypothetical protein
MTKPTSKMTCSQSEYIFGKAVAQIWADDDEHAVLSLKNIGTDMAKMNDLFEADDIKERDVDKFMKSKFVNQLNANIEEYLEKAKSESEKRKKHPIMIWESLTSEAEKKCIKTSPSTHQKH